MKLHRHSLSCLSGVEPFRHRPLFIKIMSETGLAAADFTSHEHWGMPALATGCHSKGWRELELGKELFLGVSHPADTASLARRFGTVHFILSHIAYVVTSACCLPAAPRGRLSLGMAPISNC